MRRYLAISGLQLLFVVVAICVTPPGNESPASLLLNNTVWVFGGHEESGPSDTIVTVYNTLYALDVSRSWPTSSPLWTLVGNSSLVFPRARTTLQLGADGTSLWIYGGMIQPGASTQGLSQVVRFDTSSRQWVAVNPTGANILALDGLSAVRNPQGVVFYFGGVSDVLTGSVGFTPNNQVLTLDTTTNVYSVLTTANNPLGRTMQTTTMVK